MYLPPDRTSAAAFCANEILIVVNNLIFLWYGSAGFPAENQEAKQLIQDAMLSSSSKIVLCNEAIGNVTFNLPPEFNKNQD